MTAKEKAKELIEKFARESIMTSPASGMTLGRKNAIRMALIAVDELIEETKERKIIPEYWNMVKSELEAL